MSRQSVPRWTRSLRRSWARWRQTRRLTKQVARLRRVVQKQDRLLSLRQEYLDLLRKLEPAPPQLERSTPTSKTTPPELDVPPPLTEEEIAELKAMPMPDPMEEIEFRLGLSTTPPSQITSTD